MKNKFLWLVPSCLIIFSLLLVSCGTKTTTTTTLTTTPTTTPITQITTIPTTKASTTATTITGKWWDEFGQPQYGGTVNLRLNADPILDLWTSPSGTAAYFYYYELLAMSDWTLDRNIFAFQGSYTPVEYRVGLLAESWEQPDLQTIIFHMHQGIRWQDISPVNARELTADDVEYTFNWLFGFGGGFEGSPYWISRTQYEMISTVTATDKYTVSFKAKAPTIAMLYSLLDQLIGVPVIPHEIVEKWGGFADWRHNIGSGPFILSDYVSGSSLTLDKNLNYWGYDQRYPANKLPYVDTVKILILPDDATALAALRTSKIDLIEAVSWDKAKSLSNTNPSLQQVSIPPSSVYGMRIRVDKTPFTDVRVRQAMQMAIDNETIAETYYGGTASGIPYGLIGPVMGPRLYTPYTEWPNDVQEGHSYNPDGAKKLIADSGYPNGFKTNVVVRSSDDLDLVQVVKAYLADIRVDMEIKVMDPTSFTAFVRAKKTDQMCWYHVGAYGFPPLQSVRQYFSQHTINYGNVNDPVYDQIFDNANNTLDQEEQYRLVKEADAYATANYWCVMLPPYGTFNIFQPWLKGYSGETVTAYYYARIWIDQNSK